MEKFKKFKNSKEKLIQKHIENYESSSEEENENIELIDELFKKYAKNTNNLSFGRTQIYLEETIKSGSLVCLICISSVKSNDQIWDCTACYCVFHLNCIQRWGKDSIAHQKFVFEDQNNADNSKIFNWYCPKCRNEYSPNEVPQQYKCYCKKKINPEKSNWLLPHSCGETCEKLLKPFCGHQCLMLCHPGPCPPCPQMVDSKCFCGKLSRMQRCDDRNWACNGTCDQLLKCGKHNCIKNCHSGECPPCPKKSNLPCACGNESKFIDCAVLVWSCEKFCNKQLNCGIHKCLEICHSGDCKPCPLTEPRVCPCEKETFLLPCTEPTPTCMDTCGKLLECGMHYCLQRCHREKCGNCLEVTIKTCRCGLSKKELACHKEFTCEIKCKKNRDCKKHPCNRKCCDGNCPPCEKTCGKTLKCGQHKCQSICHLGPCFPCTLTYEIKCRCGATVIKVPCGRQRKKRPPKCNENCKIPPDCNHTERDLHKCHFGQCPPCEQVCNTVLNCSHTCPEKCHVSVLVPVEDNENKKQNVPWEIIPQQRFVKKTFPCPDCKQLVSVICLGGHVTVNKPCYIAKQFSCDSQCSRLLNCGNHKCLLKCHLVENAIDLIKQGTHCENCNGVCDKPRPNLCTHKCQLKCHPNECPPCQQMLRLNCLCGISQLYLRCWEYTSIEIDAQKRELLLCCGNQCPKMYPCGHRCVDKCHSGECKNFEKCKKKVKVTCQCKRIKKEIACEQVRLNRIEIKCDEVCNEKFVQKQKELEAKQLIERQIVEEKNKKEMEEYEKKFNMKKRHKERKQRVDSVARVPFYRQHWFYILNIFIVAIAILYFCLMKK